MSEMLDVVVIGGGMAVWSQRRAVLVSGGAWHLSKRKRSEATDPSLADAVQRRHRSITRTSDRAGWKRLQNA